VGVLGVGFKLADQKGSAFANNLQSSMKQWMGVAQQAIKPLLGPLNESAMGIRLPA